MSLDPITSKPTVILFQYNPTLTLEIKGGEGGGIEALMIYGAPVETITLEAELNATDRLEWMEPTATLSGLHAHRVEKSSYGKIAAKRCVLRHAVL